MIYVVTGHLGAGKTLMAVTMAVEEYIDKGRRVASNMVLHLDKACYKDNRTTAIKLPGIPTVEHLDALGTGYDMSQPYDESKFGLILLDEAGTWLNSRDWADKDRRGLFRWITHARKLGWDVALIVQDYEALDAQIRRSVTEVYIGCRRADRIKIPYLPIRLPKMFIAFGRYGGPNGPTYKTWSGSAQAFDWYDTRQSVTLETYDTPDGPKDGRCNYSMLSAWHIRGRYTPPRRSLRDWAIYAGMLAVVTLLGAPLGLLAGQHPLAASRGFSANFWAARAHS